MPESLLKRIGFYMSSNIEGGDGGDGGSGSGNSSGKSGEGDGNSGKGSGGDGKGQGDDNKGEKMLSQEEVNKIVQKRVADLEKKHQKAMDDIKKAMNGGDGSQNNNGAGNSNGQQGGDGQNNEALVKAQAILAAANMKLVEASASAEALKLGVDPKYTADVVKLCDLSKIEVKEDGTIDTGAIAKLIDDVLKRVPVFKAQTGNDGGFKVGGEGNKNGGSNNGWGNKGTGNNDNNNNQSAAPKRWNKTNRW